MSVAAVPAPHPAPSGPPITLCGSLSLHPVGTGAAMHQAGYRALGLSWVYVPFKTTDVRGALAGMRALGIRGFGVSMPWKQEVIPHLDALSPLAAAVGAVNTIVNDDGILTGHNTDAEGSVRALEEALAPKDRTVLVLGAGGAARAVVHALVQAGAKVTLANRSEDKGRALAERAGVPFVLLGSVTSTTGFDALVNTTSLGMTDVDPRPPIDPARIDDATVVMDIVYKPAATELAKALRARRAGGGAAVIGGPAGVITGERMLLHQAARQFELYTGKPAPLAAMEEALRGAR